MTDIKEFIETVVKAKADMIRLEEEQLKRDIQKAKDKMPKLWTVIY